MLKVVVGVLSVIIFIGLICLLIHTLNTEMRKKNKAKKTRKQLKAAPIALRIWNSVENAIHSLNTLKGDPLYEPVKDKMESLVDKMTNIMLIIEKHPEYADSMRSLDNHIIPLMKKLLCNYETYMKTGVPENGKNIQDGIASIHESLDIIGTVLDQCTDQSLQNNTFELNADLKVLRSLYATDI